MTIAIEAPSGQANFSFRKSHCDRNFKDRVRFRLLLAAGSVLLTEWIVTKYEVVLFRSIHNECFKRY